jgi:branched-chain amino acid transport system ATP-binding protein
MSELLSIRGLTHRFGGLQAVSDLGLSLAKGEIAGLIGPNGAGKTTVFNLVSGFYVPSEGDIVFRGERLNGLKPHEVSARKIGRTFQNIRLWGEMTVLDNIKIAQHSRLGYGLADAFLRTRRYRDAEARIDREARDLLEVFRLQDFADECPKNLPYGTQRRVEIARALSLEPELLLLDEPAAGLGASDVVELIEYIRWIHATFGLTIWMIEHQMQVIMTLCQSITVIDFGAEIARGGPDDIRNDPRVIKAYLGDGAL